MVTDSGSPQSWLFCIGRLVDYKRRSAVRLRGKFHPAVGRRLTKPAVLYFPCLRHGKCAALPHTAALALLIAVTACMSVNCCLSHGGTTPGKVFGNGFTRVPEQEANRQIVVWLHENYFVGATPCGRPRRYSAFTYFI